MKLPGVILLANSGLSSLGSNAKFFVQAVETHSSPSESYPLETFRYGDNLSCSFKFE